MQPPIKIGTRASALARAQSGMMQRAIAAAAGVPPDQVETLCPLVLITTTGDRIQDRRLIEAGGKALFTKEIEEALLDGRIDVAVHSMKDVPADMPSGLAIAAIPEREDPRDAFISKRFGGLADLPSGARLGTASLRRQAQSLRARPDLQVEMLRGNVDTRLRRLEDGDFDAILLAAAGLNRLGRGEVIRSCIDATENPPAPGQGALALQTREADAGAAFLRALHHAPTAICVAAERGALTALEASCRTAVGAHARLDGRVVRLTVEALSADGTRHWRCERHLGLAPGGEEAQAFELGLASGREVREQAGDGLVVA
ncbi:MAG: hydroxymethylbilane synthase [Caulobacteraceae bacterium]|nr:hydroxymethylbilane synthase [Caulobacteraceae bacterium]